MKEFNRSVTWGMGLVFGFIAAGGILFATMFICYIVSRLIMIALYLPIP
jgi:hypothetical protein